MSIRKIINEVRFMKIQKTTLTMQEATEYLYRKEKESMRRY